MTSPIFEAIRDIVGTLIAKRIDYLALYPAYVAGQSGDTVDVRPDNPKIPQLSGVKILYGLPGFSAQIPNSSRVLLGWEGGDPTKPFACLWAVGSVTSVTYDGGTKNVARVDDSVGCGTVTGTSPSGAVTFTYTPEGGGTPVVSTTLTIAGKITSGNPKLKA